jgi:ornithine cyclodeaminase/alanine dehydrogenase-like protein (mu-crystallin family)
MRVLVLSHRDVLSALPPAACEQAMATALAEHAWGRSYFPLRSVMAPPGAAGFMGLMPSWRAGGQGGAAARSALKAICIMPGNPARGLDAHQGLVALFDGETGEPAAILDASAVTQVRTAAVSAVATRVLARPDVRTLAIVGAGVQARAHLAALRQVREFTEIRLFAPTTAHAQAVAESAAGKGMKILVAGTAEEAARGADVVVTATSSREPVLRHDWLAPGAHVNAIGASTRGPVSWTLGRWRPPRCSATAASRCGTRRGSSSSRSGRA